MTILRLIYEFFKTGLFAVGGGLATLPFLYEMGEKTGWFTAQDVLNLLAVSESTPGPIGINMSTYVGFITAGIPGAVIASLSLAAPCVIVILLVIRVHIRTYRPQRSWRNQCPAHQRLCRVQNWTSPW